MGKDPYQFLKICSHDMTSNFSGGWAMWTDMVIWVHILTCQMWSGMPDVKVEINGAIASLSLCSFKSTAMAYQRVNFRSKKCQQNCVWQTSSLHIGKEMCQIPFHLWCLISIKAIYNNEVTIWYQRKYSPPVCHKLRWVKILHSWVISSMFSTSNHFSILKTLVYMA